jgi:alcohol dehydrogenase
MGRVVGRELEILGSHGLDAADMPAILQRVARGSLPVRSLIGREVSLREGAAAIEAMDTGSPVGIVMVTSFR